MMDMIKHWGKLLLFLFLLSCNDDPQVTALLDRADKLSATQPDSALRLLREQQAEVNRWSKAQRIRHALLSARAMNKAYVPFTSDSKLKEVVSYYDRHGTPNERMEAHYLLGCAYRDLGEAPAAITSYMDAINFADTTSRDCNFSLMMSICGQEAELLHEHNLPEEEIDSRLSASHFAIRAKDTLYAIRGYETLIRPYYLLGDTNKVLEVIARSQDLYIQAGLPENKFNSYGTLISIMLDRGQLDSAYQLIQQLHTESGQFDKNGDIEKGREILYYIIGRYHMLTSSTDSAASYFYKVIPFNPYAGYRGLLSLYQRKHEPDSVYKYALLFESSIDKDNNIKRTEAVKRTASLYNYFRFKQKVDDLEKEKTKSRAFYLTLLAFAVAIATILFYLYQKIKTAKLQEHIRLITNLERVQSEYNQLKKEAEAYETVKTTRDSQSKEIDKLRRQIETYSQEFHKMSYAQKILSLKNSDIVKTLSEKSVWKKGQTQPTERQWGTFRRMFEQNLPSVYQRIQFLSLLEQNVCMLFFLGFNNNQLIIVLDMSSQQLTNIKSSINKKLFEDRSAATLISNLKHIM